MDKKLPIRSIQNLSKVHTAVVPDQLLEYAQQQQQQQQQRANFEEQIQHIAALQQQQQQQQQQQHQQMLAHHQQQQLQQLFLARLPFPAQSVPAISPSHNGINGVNGNSTNNNLTPTKQINSRNSSSTTKNRNGVNRKETAVSNHSNGVETGLIDLITCTLCKGYLIDATTLELCMHSFCRPCALKYIRDNHRCPKCSIEIKDKRFLNRLKSDTILQSIVYKLVPGLYEKEMARRREFYSTRPSPTPRYKCEMFGDIPPAKSIKPDDMLNVSLTWLKDPPDDEPVKTYLFCRADSTLLALKKLIIGKFGLERPIKFYYDKSEIHFDITALMDIAATFDWSPEKKILALNFREQDLNQDETDQKLENHTSTNSWPLMSSGLGP